VWGTVRRLTRVGFPNAAQQRFLDLLAEQFLSDPRILPGRAVKA